MKIAQRLTENSLVIYLFHGVIEGSDYTVRNYTRKHLGKDYFCEFIKENKMVGHPLSMDDVIEHYKTGESYPPFSFAVTFDDGFENNYSVAAPILKDLNVPATFYVTTDFIENNHMSWTDRLEYCLEVVSEGQLSFFWDQNMHVFKNREDKISLLEHLRSRVKQDPTIDLSNLVSDIFLQCGLDEITQSDDPLDLKMSWKQISELNNDENFIIGGHTHSHPILSFLNDSEIEKEIKTSVCLLDKKAGIKSSHYAYPEGLEYCYSDEVIKVLKNHDVVCCPTAEYGVNQIDCDLFRLKRIMVDLNSDYLCVE